jgi:hypothetical protein
MKLTNQNTARSAVRGGAAAGRHETSLPSTYIRSKFENSLAGRPKTGVSGVYLAALKQHTFAG